MGFKGKKHTEESKMKTSQTLKMRYRSGEIQPVVRIKSENPNWKGGVTFCKCEICGKEYRGYKSKFCSQICMGISFSKKYKGRVMSNNWKNKISKAHKGMEKPWNSGENNRNWKGGEATRINNLKKIVKERDNFKCVLCKSTKILHTHHIDYDKENNTQDNIVTLCNTCHGKTNFNRKKWIKKLRRRE